MNKGQRGLSYEPYYHEHKQVLVEPRASYISELLRQTAHVSKRVVAVVDDGILPYIEDKWVNLPRELRALDSFFHMPGDSNA